MNERTVQRLNTRRRQVLELEKDLLSMIQARSAQPLIGQEVEGRISGVQSMASSLKWAKVASRVLFMSPQR